MRCYLRGDESAAAALPLAARALRGEAYEAVGEDGEVAGTDWCLHDEVVGAAKGVNTTLLCLCVYVC
jgi:hypothetical protein